MLLSFAYVALRKKEIPSTCTHLIPVHNVLTYFQIAFLQCDRYIEFHSQYGRYYRTRIPKYGRDLAYHAASCDLYVASVRWVALR